MISWAQLRLDRSLADSMTSSRVNVFGGLAVSKQIWSELGKRTDFKSKNKQKDHMIICYMTTIMSCKRQPEAVVSVDSHEGVQCLLEESLVKLSREQSRSLADVTLSQRSNDDSASLPWSSPLDVEVGRSSFRGMLGYSCTERSLSPTPSTDKQKFNEKHSLPSSSTCSASRELITAFAETQDQTLSGRHNISS